MSDLLNRQTALAGLATGTLLLVITADSSSRRRLVAGKRFALRGLCRRRSGGWSALCVTLASFVISGERCGDTRGYGKVTGAFVALVAIVVDTVI